MMLTENQLTFQEDIYNTSTNNAAALQNSSRGFSDMKLAN
jgi:hypothetical protein